MDNVMQFGGESWIKWSWLSKTIGEVLKDNPNIPAAFLLVVVYEKA